MTYQFSRFYYNLTSKLQHIMPQNSCNNALRTYIILEQQEIVSYFVIKTLHRLKLQFSNKNNYVCSS